MLDRSHRFHGHNALNQAYKQGQNVRGAVIGLRYLANPRRPSYRVAVVVSRKVSKSAVVRNRIRRRVYAVVREQAGSIKGSYDLIFTVFNQEVATMDYKQLQTILAAQLAKAGGPTQALTDKHAIVSTEGKQA